VHSLLPVQQPDLRDAEKVQPMMMMAMPAMVASGPE